MALPLLHLLAAFAAFVASLLVPLFLLPEALRRRGMVPWKARLVGWGAYAGILAAALLLADRTGRLGLGGWSDPLLWLMAVALGLAVAWDLRQVQRQHARDAG